MPVLQSDLPPTVERLARIVGQDNALTLAGACRNGRLYVPHRIAPDHWISKTIGAESAVKVAREYGGEIIYLAKCHAIKVRFRNEAIHRLYGEGKSLRDLADLTGLTERMVRNVLAEKFSPMDERKHDGKFRA